MDIDEHIEKIRDFIGSAQPDGMNVKDLGEALYAYSELGMLIDGVDRISDEQAIQMWRLVEKLRNERFPDSLRM